MPEQEGISSIAAIRSVKPFAKIIAKFGGGRFGKRRSRSSRKAAARRGLLYHLRRNLAQLLSPETEKAAPAHPSGRGGAVYDDGRFEEQLRTLLTQGGTGAVEAGRVNLIGLNKVRDRFGAGWQEVAGRADRIARNAIERHLTPGDVYTRVQGFVYIVVFAQLSHEQAKVKCLLIAEDITKLLLGESRGDLLELKTAVAKVDGALAFEAVALSGPLITSLGGSEGLEFVDGPRLPVPLEAPQWEAIPGRWKTLRDEGADLLSDIRFVYRPIWVQSRNIVSAYHCVPRVGQDEARAVVDADLLVRDVAERARLDGLVQQRVLSDLAGPGPSSRRALLSMTVHFETLVRPATRRAFVAALERGVSPASSKRLLIEIDGVPSGVIALRLAEIVPPLRLHCRGILLRVPLCTADFIAMAGCGAFCIGADLSTRTESEFTLMMWMNRFARSAEKAGLETYLHGLRSLSQVTAAIGAGFTYLDGDAVCKPIDRPHSVVEFRLNDLYRPFLWG